MIKHNQRGAMDPLTIPLAFAVIITIISVVFGIWSYMQFSDLDTNFDAKVEQAVDNRQGEIREEVNLEFIEKEKQPYRTYQSPSTLAGVKVSYPKTWSVYADEDERSSRELNVYMHPGFIRTLDGDTPHALRIALDDKEYARELSSYQRRIEDGKLKSSVFKSSGVQGVRLEGEIDSDVTGVIVLLPVRDKTLSVWTESDEFKNDLDRAILPTLNFTP